ncbi:MAG TPA: hypothetical protein VF943_08955 [Burkholderiales bacterium]
MAMLLCTEFGPGLKKLTRSELRKMVESNNQKTFGTLVKNLRKVINVPADLEARLGKAVDIRNDLAHEYFWEWAYELTTWEGREKMIVDLTEAAAFLETLDEDLTNLNVAWARRHGITDKGLQKHEQELIARLKASGGPRKLGARRGSRKG